MNIKSIEIRSWSLPLRAPFKIALRTAHEAHNVLVTAVTQDGIQGFGAAAPAQYVTGETQEGVGEALKSLSPALIDQPLDRLLPLLLLVGEALAQMPAARAGLEMALMDAWAKRWNLPLWQYFGGALQTIKTDLTIPIVAPEEAARIAQEAAAVGFDCFKIKVGCSDGPEEDIARIRAIHAAAPHAELRIDANQAFTPEAAVTFAGAMARITENISLIEQPVPAEDADGLAYVHDRIHLPLFADESACSPAQVLRLLETKSVDGINVKLMKSGILGALDIVSLCRTSGTKLMFGCMLESPLGIAAACALARGTGAFHHIDLDSHRLLREVSAVRGFREDGPSIQFDQERGGWGVWLEETGTEETCEEQCPANKRL